jgi:NADH-quinone oxidoreductase subunit C
LKEKFPEAVTETVVDTTHPHVVVQAEHWPEVARFLRDDDELKFDWLRCISSVDLLADNQLAAVYDLHATEPSRRYDGVWKERHAFAVKVKVPRDNPHVPTVSDVWPAADWHEREAYDLMGIVFDGHPDSVDSPTGRHPRRILCPDDWVGHALRKDYEFPDEYEGIPGTTEKDQETPVH